MTETFDSVNKALSDACELALKHNFPGKQPVFVTDASYRRAGYALMIEDIPDKRSNQKGKRTHLSRWIKSPFPGTDQDVNLLRRIFGNLDGIS